MHVRVMATLAIMLGITGCGTTVPMPIKGNMAGRMVAQRSLAPKASPTLEKAAAAAMAHAEKAFGGTWQVKRIYADDAWTLAGAPQPTRWRVNLLSDATPGGKHQYLKLYVLDDGSVVLPDNVTGPWPDTWQTDKEPSIEVPTNLPAAEGLKIALGTRLGVTYAPTTPISYEAGYADRLKRLVSRYKWRSQKPGGVVWYLEVVLDPKTGEVVELDATRI